MRTSRLLKNSRNRSFLVVKLSCNGLMAGAGADIDLILPGFFTLLVEREIGDADMAGLEVDLAVGDPQIEAPRCCRTSDG